MNVLGLMHAIFNYDIIEKIWHLFITFIQYIEIWVIKVSNK